MARNSNSFNSQSERGKMQSELLKVPSYSPRKANSKVKYSATQQTRTAARLSQNTTNRSLNKDSSMAQLLHTLNNNKHSNGHQ